VNFHLKKEGHKIHKTYKPVSDKNLEKCLISSNVSEELKTVENNQFSISFQGTVLNYVKTVPVKNLIFVF